MSMLFILGSALIIGSTPGTERAAEVRSLLASRCYACHGPDVSGRKADLRLDTTDGQRSRRRSGSPVVPGDPGSSLILQRITHDDIDYRMPAEAPPLDEEDVALLNDWIEDGAPWPVHWAWEPIENPPVPEVADSKWVRDPIDAFVLARLESAGLSPAGEVTPSTWLRRVHFDLVGLPPSPGIIESFETDSASDPEGARSRVVDTLLASPHFGEHWGRHWLDLVRYAETCGHEFDYPIPHAWRYRDWVIRAFNSNVPYDRFLIEHVAGDLVPDPRTDPGTGLDDSIPGTGFWYMSQGTHAPVDVRQDEADRIADQLDVFGKAFSALTISCARCHDHKFDPIGTSEYYALSGYMQSSRRRDAYLDPDGRIERQLLELETSRRLIADSMTGPVPVEEVQHASDDGSTLMESFDVLPDGWFPDGQAFTKPLVTGQPYLQDDQLFIAGSGQWHSGLRSSRSQGAVRSPSFRIEHDWLHHRVKGRDSRIRIVIDGFMLNEYNPLLFEDCLKDIGNEEWHHVAQRVGKYRGHVAWIEYSDDGDGWIAIDELRASDSDAEPNWSSPKDPPTPEIDPGQLKDRLAALQEIEVALETPTRVLSITEGTPEDEVIFIRGNHATPGPISPRSTPSILNTPVKQPPSGSGRLELARSLVAKTNPMTARVMANRTWHYLLGRGIVDSVDDFGAMGRSPSHPLLLDHLASRFREDWSLKNLLRAIVLSRTYALSSRPDPEAMAIDPGNRLMHHRPVKRLTAESIRDALLSSSGTLDPTVGGPPVATYLTEYMTGRGRPAESGPLDGSSRRTVYLEVRRNFISPLLLAFDMPTPSSTTGRRSVSNVPAQSLTLMNDPFVHEQCMRWSRNILDSTPGNRDRLRSMYLSAFGRGPEPGEEAAALEFIQEQARSHGDLGDENPELAAWADLGHVLVNTKEFIYLD